MSDVLVIGAGLGGLLCGRILSRKGFRVTLLEADFVPGGLLHGFLWNGVLCERGFHSVGGLGPGEPLEKVFRPLGLMDLPWYRADADEGFPFLRLNAGTEYEREHILGPFRQSVWRLRGGGTTLAGALAVAAGTDGERRVSERKRFRLKIKALYAKTAAGSAPMSSFLPYLLSTRFPS